MSDTTTTTPEAVPTVEGFLAFAGEGKFEGQTTESLGESTATLTKAAMAAGTAYGKAATALRVLAYALLAVRATIMVQHSKTGQIGPDWEGKSQLARDYTNFAVTTPLLKKMTATQISGLLNEVGVYQGRKDPDRADKSDLPLREAFILDWVTAHAPEGTTPEAIRKATDEQFANIGKLTAAAKKAKSLGGGGGPKTTKDESPTVVLTTAVDAVVKSEADLVNADLVGDAVRILRRFAAQIVKSGEVTGRPEVLPVWEDLTAGVMALSDYIDGTQTDGAALRAFAGIEAEVTTTA